MESRCCTFHVLVYDDPLPKLPLFGNFIVQLLSCCDRDTLSNKDHVSEIVQLSKNWGEWISTILIIWQLEVFCLIQQKPYMRSTGMSQIYMYMHTSIHVSNKSYYLLQQIKLSPNVFETCDPCSGFHSSWSNFLPPFQPTCSLHGVFHCPSCAGRQLPLKGRCPWESSWRIASNICRSSFQPRWDRKSPKKQNTHIKFDTCLSPHKATQLWRNTSEIRGIESDCYLFWGPKCQISAMLSLLSCVFPAPVPGKCFPLRAEMRHPQSPEFEHIYYLL